MTAPQWIRHFALTEAPFSKDLADNDLWLPSSKQDLVDELVEAVDERQHALLVGEPGVGKTCTLRALRRRLPEAGFRLTYCHNATLGRRDFYRQLCLSLGLSPKATAAAVFYAISSHVEELGRDRIHPVFLLDESHLLRQDVLDHLHVLSNYEWDSKPLLSLVLVGLPELWARLKLARNRSLWSRIHCRIRIEDASDADTVEYVNTGNQPRVLGLDSRDPSGITPRRAPGGPSSLRQAATPRVPFRHECSPTLRVDRCPVRGEEWTQVCAVRAASDRARTYLCPIQ